MIGDRAQVLGDERHEVAVVPADHATGHRSRLEVELDLAVAVELRLHLGSERLGDSVQRALLVQRESAAEPPQGALGLPTEQRLIDPEQLTVVGQHADVLLEFLGGDHWWRSGSGVVVDTH